MTNLIENNAYRILGLDVSASQKDILRRYKEIVNRLKIEDKLKYELDVGLSESLRSEETAKEALGALQSPKENIKEYFFWFSISNTNDKKALDYIAKGEYLKAIETWKSLLDVESSAAYSYKKNLAILYCLLLSKEDNEKYLKTSLSIWKELLSSEKFWTEFSKNYSMLNEQTANQESLLQFKDLAVKEISDIYTDLGQKHKNSKYVKSFQEAFGAYGEKTEKEVLQPAYREIYDEVEKLKKIIVSPDGSQIVEDVAKEKFQEVYDAILIIQKKLNKLRKTGLYNTTESKVMRDHVAETIRSKAVDLHNYAALYDEAQYLAKIAAKISGTESYREGLLADESKIEKSIEADSKILLTVTLSGLFSSKNVIFKPRFVEYEEKKIFYKDVDQVALYGVRNQYGSGTFSVVIGSGENQISFSISNPDTWNKAFGIASQFIIPWIVKKYTDRIFEKNEAVGIGDVTFDKKGYTHPKFWGGIDSVPWSYRYYIPKFFMGNVILYKQEESRVKQFASIPMSTLNAVIIPALVQVCTNIALAKGLIKVDKTQLSSPTPFQGTQFGANSNNPPDGSKTWQEYYEKIDKGQRPELLKHFEESGGKNLSKAEIDALKLIHEANLNDSDYHDVDKKLIERLVSKGYIRKEGEILSTKYVIEKKGYNILNWISYKYK